MSRTLRLLQVADSSGDAELVVRLLLKADYTVEARRVQDAGAMKSALADSGWDLIVCDYRMQKFDAPAALATLHEAGLDIPFLVVSGTTGVDVAVAMMKAGAHDYLMKDNLTPLGATVKRELRDAETRAERRGALHQLQEREARFALAAASTEMGIFDYNPGTGKVLYSDVFKRHLDVPPELEPTLAGFLELLHPEDRPRIGRSVERAFLPESGGHYAEEYRTKAMVNGEAKWVSAWGRVLYDGEKPVRFLGVVRDITERKRAELELQFQLRLTACITQQSTDCILLADVDNRIRLVNPEVCRVFGYTMEECQGKIPHELLHHHYPDGRPYPASECMLSQMMRSGEDLRDHEDLLFHKDGTPIDVGGSGVPLTLNGVRVGTMFTFRDIRERKSAERALLQSDVRFRRLFEADIVGIVISDGERIVETNDAGRVSCAGDVLELDYSGECYGG